MTRSIGSSPAARNAIRPQRRTIVRRTKNEMHEERPFFVPGLQRCGACGRRLALVFQGALAQVGPHAPSMKCANTPDHALERGDAPIDDHFVMLARAQQVLYGDWPVRDFEDPGQPLFYL